MRLWWVEVSRLFARRFTRVALVLLVVILGLFVFTAAYGSEKPSAGSLARAEQEAAAERAATRARCEAVKGETPGGDTATDRPGAPVPSTTASPGTPPTAQPTTQPTTQPTAQPTTQPTAQPTTQPTATSEPGPSASPDGELFPGEFQGVDCATIAHPTAQDMLRSDYFSFRDDMPLRTIGVAVLLALLGYLVAASFVGAEWQHGTMAGLLLWEPRRVKVFLAKLFALFTGLAVVGVLAYAVTFGAHWLVADTLGDTAGVGPAFQRSLALTALRGIAVALVIAACGFAVAYAARLSAAALGLAIAYFIGAEIGLRLYRPESQPWLLTENVKAWLERGSTISIYDCADPSRCTERVLTLTMWQGGAYLAGLALILAVIAAVLFARRDVT